MNLSESSARCGAHCWVERQVFEAFGAWSRAATSAEATILLDRHSLHAAWRAEQWWDRLPVLAGVERDGLVVASPGWERLLGTAPPRSNVALLAVAYRVVLPRLVAGYRTHFELTSAVADGPVRRTLGHAGDDARRDWEEGEVLVQSCLDNEGSVAEAAGAAGRAELAFLDGGGPAVSVGT